MRGTWVRLLAVVAVGALALGACSSSKKSSASSTSTTAATKKKPVATATPTTGLTNGAVVTVKVTGFKPGLTLGINECAEANGGAVGQDDCDLGGIKVLTVGADGTGTGTTNASSGPIGKNAHMCATAGTRCFLSVGELTAAADAQRADDINLTFTG